MTAERNAEARKPNAYHRVEELNDDDPSKFSDGDKFMVELRMDGLQDAKVMSEDIMDMNASTIIGLGQNIKAKIVKRVSS